MKQQVTVSIKVRLYPKSLQTCKDFQDTSKQYARSCSYVSKTYWSHNCDIKEAELHHDVYYTIRNKFGLKAQEAGSVPRTVLARYKAVKTQLYYQVKRYKDKYSNNMFYINKKLSGLWNPIHFRRPQTMLQRKNDWSFVIRYNQPLISISVLSGRDKVEYYIPPYFKQYMKKGWKLGGARLIKSSGHWYLHISASHDISSWHDIKNLVGSDRGQRFIIYSYDNNKHSLEISGLKIRRKRSHFLKQRAILQHKHTRSAKRKLRCISGQENCWSALVNHKVSKALVHQYGRHTVYAYENLRGVKFEAMNSFKRDRYSRAIWPFYNLGQKTIYKSLLHHSKVIHVNPQFTSQRCPHCGCVMKLNRNHEKHIFVCKNCGYSSNDDRIGAMNIYSLAKLQLLGYNKPFIKKDNQIGYHIKIDGKKKNKIEYLSRLEVLKLFKRPINQHRSISRA